MTLKEAVKMLGGPTATARLTQIGRTHINYWLKSGYPAWRKPEVDRIISVATDLGGSKCKEETSQPRSRKPRRRSNGGSGASVP